MVLQLGTLVVRDVIKRIWATCQNRIIIRLLMGYERESYSNGYKAYMVQLENFVRVYAVVACISRFLPYIIFS